MAVEPGEIARILKNTSFIELLEAMETDLTKKVMSAQTLDEEVASLRADYRAIQRMKARMRSVAGSSIEQEED